MGVSHCHATLGVLSSAQMMIVLLFSVLKCSLLGDWQTGAQAERVDKERCIWKSGLTACTVTKEAFSGDRSGNIGMAKNLLGLTSGCSSLNGASAFSRWDLCKWEKSTPLIVSQPAPFTHVRAHRVSAGC